MIVAARKARADLRDITFWFEGFGWYVGATSVWIIAAPRPWLRLTEWFWDAFADPDLRRAFGVLTLAFGLFFGWVALSVL